jgi:uncharacterized protein (DUF1778 family)
MDRIQQTRMTDAQYAAILLAANKMGLTVSAYIRMAALNHARALGFNDEQPRDYDDDQR